MEFLKNPLACEIQTTCMPFNVGVTVNLVFFALSVAVLLVMHVTQTPRAQIRSKVYDELQQQWAHIGYSLYLVAGCAFFGSILFSDYPLLPGQRIFGVAWAVLLLLLLLTETINALINEASVALKYSRKIAIPPSFAAIYSVWIGADFDLPKLWLWLWP